MLRMYAARAHLRRASQQGMVLLVALIVLVAVMVAGIAMVRSVDTATLVAGNLAFEQAATHAADRGVEAAVLMLGQKRTDETLSSNDTSSGYFASLQPLTDNPAAGQSWQAFWQATLKDSAVDVGEDPFNNRVFYVVNRMCANAMPPGSGGMCVASPTGTTQGGSGEEVGDVALNSASQIYYPNTVRVAGPRRTESYVQTIVAM